MKRSRIKPRAPRALDADTTGVTTEARAARRAERDEAIRDACEAAKARDRYRCQAERRGIIREVRCWGPLDPQHIIPRSTRPDLADDVTNIVALCRGHHEWVGANPEEARELGLHGYAGDRP